MTGIVLKCRNVIDCSLSFESRYIYCRVGTMGTFIELNDTLLITAEQGFPVDMLNLEKHILNPILLADVQNTVFNFQRKAGARIFSLAPVRVFLVEHINGKWLFWGKAVIESQTMAAQPGSPGYEWQTSGSFRIIDLYEPAYQRMVTLRESPEGKSYF